MLIVMATLRAQPEHAQTLGALLDELAAASRAEHGCSAYRVFRCTGESTLFGTFEQWDSAAAEVQHMASAHVAEAFRRAAPLLAGAPEIRHFEEIG